jgi:hypothetical protein
MSEQNLNSAKIADNLDPACELPYRLAAVIIQAASEAGQMAASGQVSTNPKISCTPGRVHRRKSGQS